MFTRNQRVDREPSRVWLPMIDTWDNKLFSALGHKPMFRELLDVDGEQVVDYGGDLNIAPQLPRPRPLDLTRGGKDFGS